MSYIRITPRDLFNEANLLKCYGKLYLQTEHMRNVEMENDGLAFDIAQDVSGDITIRNVDFLINGTRYHLARPLNSREPWPLYIEVNGEQVEVFNDDGSLSVEMLKLLAR